LKKSIQAFGIIFLFILSAISPIVISNNINTSNNLIPESTGDDSLMDSAWPMYCHDTRHTGLSPYSTIDNPGLVKWRINLVDAVKGSPVIDENNNIYVGADHIFAIYPNGTLKWENDNWVNPFTAPAIDKNGILYVGSCWASNYLYAIYTSNGTLMWKYTTGSDVESSPVIGNDSTIYIGDWNGDVHAVYQNGTRKWKYHTGDVITSSPAIGLDGTIYIGSHDDNLYAFYPNGTVKWKFKTGSWVHGSPSIADDGTIYIGSDDGKLYALYPDNGTMKWKVSIGATWCSPVIDDDGTIYAGVFQENVFAINPNGTIKWKYDAPGRIWFGESIAISADGTLYFGTTWMDGGDEAFIALNSDGTERWIKRFGGIESSPAIAEDGTIYVGSNDKHLYAIGKLDNDAPTAPTITGQINGIIETEYEYKFKSTSPLGRDVYYYIEWGDGSKKDWFGPFNSGEEVTVSHSWSEQGTYTIKARAKDTENLWGPWGELMVTMPRDKSISNSLLLKFLERYPLLNILLTLIIK